MSCFLGSGRFLHPFAFTTVLLEPPQIHAEDRMGLDTVLQAAQLQIQFRRRLFRETVNHPLPVSSGGHQAAGPQVGKMFGNCNLRQPQNALEMTDTQRAMRQEMQDAETSLIAKAPVDLQQLHILH